MEFKSLDLHPDLARAIEEAGFTTAMPVQEAVFVHAFVGDDIYAQSQTGTGKTAAFLIPILQRIMTVPAVRTRKVLVLAPTRELAAQIEGDAVKLAKYLPISSASFFGGVGYGPQVEALRANVQIMIGTPGRIIDLIQQGKMLLKEVGFLVIDEADRMFDMGFIDDLRRLIRYLPPASERQTFLFSATLGLRVKDLAWEYMTSPHEIVIEPENVTVDLVTQELHHVGSHEKMGLLLGILERDRPESAIIFANQKYMVEEISRRLRINGVENEYIMGDLPQSKRLDIIDRLKAGRLRILVATDVAARGLDVEALDLVINYDVPEDAESYVHRIGRTARAGKAGKAITLACEKFVFGLPAIEKFIGKKIPVSSFDSSIMLEDRSAGMRFGRGARDFQARSGRGPTPREGPRREGPRRDGPRREGPPRGREGGRPGRDARPVHVERRLTREESPHREEQRPRPPHRDQSVEAAGADRDGPNPYNLSSEERMARYKEKYAAEAAGQGGTRQAGPNRPNPRNESRRPEGRGPSAPQTPRRSGQPGPHGQRRPEEIRGPGRDPNLPKGPRPEGPKQQRPDITKPRPQQPAATTIPVAPEKKPGLLGRIKKLFGGK